MYASGDDLRREQFFSSIDWIDGYSTYFNDVALVASQRHDQEAS